MKSLNRRKLMALSLGALASPMTASASTKFDVIVVGAGLAGLSAARELADNGKIVVVLEARERIGGRIHTSILWPDLPIDLGASWIHGLDKNPLTNLARSTKATLVETSYNAALYLEADGTPAEPDLAPARRILKSALKSAENRSDDVSIMSALTDSNDWKAATERQRRLVLHVVNSTLEQEYGGAAGQLSAWHGDSAEEFDGADAIFPDGFAAIPAHLAAGLDIRLSHPVRSIEPGRVTLADGRQLEAGQIVVTVPLGVLKAATIKFTEPLASARQAAIDRLKMGLLNKTWLRFEKTAWPDDVDWIEWLGPKTGVWAEWLSLARTARLPVLLGFNAANEAAEIEALDDRETVSSALAALRTMFGNAFPAPIAWQVTRWGRDPLALGSYSFNAVGTSAKTRRQLAGSDWDGALWFAGEACEPNYFGTAHGAVISGRDTAKAML